jgi:hypothetical protein
MVCNVGATVLRQHGKFVNRRTAVAVLSRSRARVGALEGPPCRARAEPLA